MQSSGAQKWPFVVLILVAALMLPVPPVRAQAGSPVGDQLVGTLLGTPSTQSVQDARESTSHPGLSDFVFLPNGDTVFASSVENRLFRAGPDGLVVPFAGNGGYANGGDGGEAIAAGIANPQRLAVDDAGNVYVAHWSGEASGASWIRRISPSGTISKVAGGARPGCPVAGSLANGADLGAVSALAASADALYFAVTSCGRIYRIGADGLISVFAGQPTTDPGGVELRYDFFSAPAKRAIFVDITGLAVDKAGNVLVADRHWQKILRVTSAGVVLRVAGTPSDLAGGRREGAATGIFFPLITSIAASPDGSILVTQTSPQPGGTTGELGLIDTGGVYRILFTLDGANGRPAASLGSHLIVPDLVRMAPDGAFYVRDSSSGIVLRVLPNGAAQAFLGLPPKPEIVTMNGKLSSFEVRYTTKPVADTAGNLYVGALGKLYKLSPEGELTHIAGNGGATSGGGNSPLDAALGIDFTGRFEELQIDDAGNLYWRVTGGIRKLSKDGVISDVVGRQGNDLPSGLIEGQPARSLAFGRIAQWSVAGNGDVYFVYTIPPGGFVTSPAIWRVGADGLVRRVAGTTRYEATLPNPDGKPALEAVFFTVDQMSVARDGGVFFAVRGSIFRIDPLGIARLVAYAPAGTALSDGMPTVSAPSEVRGLLALAADQLLAAPKGEPSKLAKYTVGGTARLWRDAAYGTPVNDGAFLKEDRFSSGSTLPLLMPDGGLAWIEVQRERSIVRRSFPVPAGCSYTINANELTAGGGNSLLSLTLTAAPECPWTVGSSSNWVEILSARYGKGAATISLRVNANAAPEERVATLRVAGKEVLVKQGASVRTDIFVVSPASAVIPPGGGSVRVTISASAGLSWQVGLPEVPVGIEGPSAGSGSGSFVLSLGALPAGVSERTAVVSVNGKSVTLRQAARLVPVPVTIDSTLVGTKAVIDLVERTLPYAAQWAPGSIHLFQAQPFTKVSDQTIVQFENFGAGNATAEQVFMAPPVSSTLTARFRRLHLLKAGKDIVGQSALVGLAPSFLGIPVPREIASSSMNVDGFAMWYPEGSRVEIFAPMAAGVAFTGFTGAQSTTENPAAISMQAPANLTAHYAQANGPSPMFLFGAEPQWWFYGDERKANSVQVTVEEFQKNDGPLSRRFVAYESPVGTPDWLRFYTGSSAAPHTPFTLEVGVDAAKAAGLKLMDPAGSTYAATVYLYEPGKSIGWFNATAKVSPTPEDDLPWIAAVTDAGGFRQSTSAGYPPRLLTSPGMILSLFGLRFGARTLNAPALPLPVSLGGVSVEFRVNSRGAWMQAPLFFVSPTQINFQVPPGASFASREDIDFRVRTSATVVSEPWRTVTARRAASLFSADSSGGGAPAGFYVRVAPNGQQRRGELYRCENGVCSVPAVSFGGPDSDIFLEIYGTGFRNLDAPENLRAYIGGCAAEVTFAGPHAQFAGLDQVNVKVPRDIRKGVPLDLYIWVRTEEPRWAASNRLVVRFE